MYPEDRVLVAYVPSPADFTRVVEEGWYRIPFARAPKGVHSEYFAFYFGRRFGPLKWAIHYYAKNQGHELVRRIDLLPTESNHPRANRLYYKIQLASPLRRERPIVNLRWRRLLFLHTTWDRFEKAAEIGDLLLKGDNYVDRPFSVLRDQLFNQYQAPSEVEQ